MPNQDRSESTRILVRRGRAIANFRAANPSSRVGQDNHGNTPASLLTAMQNYTGLRESPPIVPVPRSVFLFRNNIVGGSNYITQDRISNILAFGSTVDLSLLDEYKYPPQIEPSQYDSGIFFKDRLILTPFFDFYAYTPPVDGFSVWAYGNNTYSFRATPEINKYMVDYIHRRRNGIVRRWSSAEIYPDLLDITKAYGITITTIPDGQQPYLNDTPDIMTISWTQGQYDIYSYDIKVSIPVLYGPSAFGEVTLWYVTVLDVGTDLDTGFLRYNRPWPARITFGTSNPDPMRDDVSIPIPMNGIEFNFFGYNYNANIYWNSNNVITFGTMSAILESTVSYSCDSAPAILLGNYDRLLKSFSTLTREGPKFSVTEILVEFLNYFNDDTKTAQTYTWIIKLIKENVGPKRQYIEVSTGPNQLPDAGYSSSRMNYPSGTGIDSKNMPIDPTKNSPFNITNGSEFLNPFGQTYMTTAPPANTSFVLWSDSTGTNWSFVDKAQVRL